MTRCFICNTKIRRIIESDAWRGGVAPCNECRSFSYATSVEDDGVNLYYDPFNSVDLDIEEVTDVETVDGLT